MEKTSLHLTEEFEIGSGQSLDIPAHPFDHLSFSTTVAQVGVEVMLCDTDGNPVTPCKSCKIAGYGYCCSLSERQVVRKDVKVGRSTKATFTVKGRVTVICTGLEDHKVRIRRKLGINLGIIESK